MSCAQSEAMNMYGSAEAKGEQNMLESNYKYACGFISLEEGPGL